MEGFADPCIRNTQDVARHRYRSHGSFAGFPSGKAGKRKIPLIAGFNALLALRIARGGAAFAMNEQRPSRAMSSLRRDPLMAETIIRLRQIRLGQVRWLLNYSTAST